MMAWLSISGVFGSNLESRVLSMNYMKVQGAVAYEPSYVEEVMFNMGYMCHCSVALFNTPLEELFPKFIDSPFAYGIEHGEPHYMVGFSGKEMAEGVLHKRSSVKYYFDMGNIYMWVGHSIALVQWYTGYPFKRILEMQPLSVWYYMYNVYHTMDESKLLEWADGVFIRW